MARVSVRSFVAQLECQQFVGLGGGRRRGGWSLIRQRIDVAFGRDRLAGGDDLVQRGDPSLLAIRRTDSENLAA